MRVNFLSMFLELNKIFNIISICTDFMYFHLTISVIVDRQHLFKDLKTQNAKHVFVFVKKYYL